MITQSKMIFRAGVDPRRRQKSLSRTEPSDILFAIFWKSLASSIFCVAREPVALRTGDRLADSQSERLVSLDGFRAISVILVIFCHATDSKYASPQLHHFSPYFSGVLGVRIFFVISGFIITYLLIKEKNSTKNISLKAFYTRRFLRLFPVQFIYITTIFLFTQISKLNISSCAFITALTYTKNYACAAITDGHFWSLSVEEQFYLFWPLILLIFSRRWVIYTAILLITIAPVSRAIEYHSGNHNWWWLTSNVDALMIGCVVAMSVDASWLRRIVLYRPFLGRLSAMILIVVPIVMTNYLILAIFTVPFGPILQELCIAYLIISCMTVKKGVLYVVLNNTVVVFIGLASYSLYVWQQIFFYTTATDYGIEDLFFFHFPANVIAAFFVGLLSYCAVERPMVRVRRAFGAARHDLTHDQFRVSDDLAAHTGDGAVSPGSHKPIISKSIMD